MSDKKSTKQAQAAKPAKPAKKPAKKKPIFRKKEVADVPVTAPVPAKLGSRPTLEESRRRLRSSQEAKQAGLPGQVTNKQPDLEYYYWDALELSDERQVRLRLMLGQRGYFKADGSEFVVGVPHAEIWAIYKEVYAEIRKESEKQTKEAQRRVARGL